ncbi:MAG: glycerol-3-phosphate 1-O-acyltransferase PlsY [Planctomycetes bacterium]|nr:glycerol-3-phosphate 1-O-acyltransferase PlsY [Planctomycetota bacterium]
MYFIDAAAIGLAYLVGGIPFGLILGRIVKGIDIRTVGSGNIGATNLARTCGKTWGVVAFLLDFGKGVAAAALIAPAANRVCGPGTEEIPLALACGLAAVLGHVFPPYLGFRGGKGVATGAGVAAAVLAPIEIGVGVAVWVAALAIGRVVGPASVLAAIAVPIAVAIRRGADPWAERGPVLVFAAAIAILVAIRHRKNLQTLWRRRRGGEGKA